MKKIILSSFFVFLTMISYAQVDVGENPIRQSTHESSVTAKYRLFPTQNMWTFIKLNTRNGLMWQVQFDVQESNRFETFLNLIPLVQIEDEVDERFTLYPTQNIYNFILLDQLDGRVWQVQWSMEPENRIVIPIE